MRVQVQQLPQLGWIGRLTLLTALLLHGAPPPCSGQSPSLPSIGDVVAVSQAISSLLKGDGKNLRSIMSPGGCLDGGFSASDRQVVGQGFGGWTGTARCTDVSSTGRFTIGYWDTCQGGKAWQMWKLTEGKLYCAMGQKWFGADRCVDAFSVTERKETIACGYDCWGGKGQEMVVRFAGRVAASQTREAAFTITPRFAQDTCLTYIGDQKPVRFRPCTKTNNQLWFIPGELPQPSTGEEDQLDEAAEDEWSVEPEEVVEPDAAEDDEEEKDAEGEHNAESTTSRK